MGLIERKCWCARLEACSRASHPRSGSYPLCLYHFTLYFAGQFGNITCAEFQNCSWDFFVIKYVAGFLPRIRWDRGHTNFMRVHLRRQHPHVVLSSAASLFARLTCSNHSYPSSFICNLETFTTNNTISILLRGRSIYPGLFRITSGKPLIAGVFSPHHSSFCVPQSIKMRQRNIVYLQGDSISTECWCTGRLSEQKDRLNVTRNSLSLSLSQQ